MVLDPLGCPFQGYPLGRSARRSDCRRPTRTWPASYHFSAASRRGYIMNWPSRSSSALAITALCAVSQPLDAQAARRDRLMVSVDWLAEHLQEPGIVLLHVGPEDEYA